MKEAYDIESRAAKMLYSETNMEPARSILFQSAANIAYEAEMHDEAHKMIYAALSGNPPQHIANNLNALQENIQFSKHLISENLEISKNTLNISIFGSTVGDGIVPYDAFKRKIDAVEKMLNRTIQRKKFPDTFVSDMMYKIRRQFPIFVQALEPGCLSVALKLGLDESNESNVVDRDMLESAIAEFATDIDLLNKDDFDALKTKINNDEYYKSITDIYKELLPDGTKIKGVNIVANVDETAIEIHITKTKQEMISLQTPLEDTDPILNAEIGSELVLEGHLKMADSTKKEPYVKLILSDDKEQKIFLDEATIDDVVSSYWDEYVAIKTLKKTKTKLMFLEIQSK